MPAIPSNAIHFFDTGQDDVQSSLLTWRSRLMAALPMGEHFPLEPALAIPSSTTSAVKFVACRHSYTSMSCCQHLISQLTAVPLKSFPAALEERLCLLQRCLIPRQTSRYYFCSYNSTSSILAADANSVKMHNHTRKLRNDALAGTLALS